MSDFWLKVLPKRPWTVPTRSTDGAAAYDLYATHDAVIEPGEQAEFPLEFSAAFPRGWAAQIWDRSSMGRRALHRMAGLIDADYRGEWIIILRNHGHSPKEIRLGDRIAQVVFVPVGLANPEIVYELPESVRAEGGFGSTGR